MLARLAAFASLQIVLCVAGPCPAFPEDVLRSLHEARETFTGSQRQARKFDIEARVSLRVRGWKYFWLQEGTLTYQAEILPSAFDEQQSVGIGDLVRVTGVTSDSRNLFYVETIELVEEGDAEDLEPVPARSNGRFQFWRYVHFEGQITEVHRQSIETRLRIEDDDVSVWCTFHASGRIHGSKRLLGKRVRAEGVLLAETARSSGGERRPRITTSEPEQFTFLEGGQEAPATIFKTGFINHIGEDSFIACGWKIRASIMEPLKLNKPVSVALVDVDNNSRTATAVQVDVRWGPTHPSLPITNLDTINRADSLYKVVAIAAELKACRLEAENLILQLQQGEVNVTALLPRACEPEFTSTYQLGQQVNVVGAVHFRDDFPDEAFALYVSAIDDLRSTDPQPLLSRRETFWGGVIGGGCMLVMFTWQVALRRSVRRKTRELSQLNAVVVAAASAVRNGILIVDADDRVVQTNDNLTEMFGKLRSGCSGKQVMDGLAKARLATSKELLDFLERFDALHGGIGHQEFKAKNPDGWISINTASVLGPEGNAAGRIWTFEDVTDRVRLEHENAQSRKLQAVGRLAGGVAHDFNNLLQAVGASLQTLRISDSCKDEDQRVIENAYVAVERGASLTRQLLAFSSRTPMRREVVSVNSIVHQVHSLFSCTVNAKIAVRLCLSEESLYISADEGQIEQVIMNLCFNARDAIGDNQGTISICTHSSDEPPYGQCAIVTVYDDGCGIAEEVLPQIFEPFFTTKQSSEGTGLGLSMAHGIAKQHGGSIRCTSNHEEATQFELILPLSPAPEHVSPAPAPAVPALAVSDRVLLVDDDPMVLDASTVLLETMGYKVDSATDGVDALEHLAKTTEYDAVILDMTMPRMSGIETLQQIRAKRPDIRVVLCSGYSEDVKQIAESDIRPDAFLAKPFSIAELSEALDGSRIS